MFAVFDSLDKSRPYIFQDQEKGTQTVAVFIDHSEAVKIAERMTQLSKTHQYVVDWYFQEK